MAAVVLRFISWAWLKHKQSHADTVQQSRAKRRVEIMEQEARVATTVLSPPFACWMLPQLPAIECHSKPFSKIEMIATCHCKTHLVQASKNRSFTWISSMRRRLCERKSSPKIGWPGRCIRVYQGWGCWVEGSVKVKVDATTVTECMASWRCFPPSQGHCPAILAQNHRA